LKYLPPHAKTKTKTKTKRRLFESDDILNNTDIKMTFSSFPVCCASH
jgi:hypothetical protein